MDDNKVTILILIVFMHLCISLWLYIYYNNCRRIRKWSISCQHVKWLIPSKYNNNNTIIIIITSSCTSVPNGKTPSKVDVDNDDNNNNRWQTVFDFLLPWRILAKIHSTTTTTKIIKYNIASLTRSTIAKRWIHWSLVITSGRRLNPQWTFHLSWLKSKSLNKKPYHATCHFFTTKKKPMNPTFILVLIGDHHDKNENITKNRSETKKRVFSPKTYWC